jgi:hypothetical protein
MLAIVDADIVVAARRRRQHRAARTVERSSATSDSAKGVHA